MKELITAEAVKEMAARKQKQILLTSNTIITPAARDRAAELGIEIVQEGSPPTGLRDENWKKVSETVVQFLREEFGDQPLDEETVRTIVTKVLERLG